MIEHVRQIIRLRANVSLHGPQDRLFAQIVSNELRHVRVDRLIVSHAVAHRVRQRHVARPVRSHQPRHAKNRVRAKGQRIEKFVIDAPVDHVHPRQPADRLHVNDAAIHDQVAPFDQLDAHLLREEAVFEVGAVVNARRQQDDLRVVFAARRKAAQDARKLRGIMVHRQHLAGLKSIRKSPRHHRGDSRARRKRRSACARCLQERRTRRSSNRAPDRSRRYAYEFREARRPRSPRAGNAGTNRQANAESACP